MSQMHGAATHLFARAAGLDPESKEAMLRTFLVIGQVVFLRIAEAAVIRRLQIKRYDDELLSEVKAIVRRNVRAMVKAAREGRI
jgi:hypothetical protein